MSVPQADARVIGKQVNNSRQDVISLKAAVRDLQISSHDFMTHHNQTLDSVKELMQSTHRVLVSRGAPAATCTTSRIDAAHEPQAQAPEEAAWQKLCKWGYAGCHLTVC